VWFAYHIAIVMGIDGVYEGDMFFYGVSLGVIITHLLCTLFVSHAIVLSLSKLKKTHTMPRRLRLANSPNLKADAEKKKWNTTKTK